MECIEGVEVYRYLGRLLDRSDGNWAEFLQNIRKVKQVWERIRKMLQREGAEPTVSEKFNCAVIQALLLFGAGTWVLLAPMV